MHISYPVNYPEMVTMKSEGITDSEKKLVSLGYRSFLSLWSYPNPYKKQPGGKELCDLLVVFEDHIIVFSDKDCIYGQSGDDRIDWRRWYKKAIQKSANQLLGAKKWIIEHPKEISLDASNKSDFPLTIDITPQTKFHLIAVAHGASDRCKQFFGGGNGGLITDNSIISDMHTNDICAPFSVGLVEPAKEDFVHVFDDASYEAVLKELDTIQDFICYLEGRKHLLLSSKLIITSSEIDLLAQHITGVISGNYNALRHLAESEYTEIMFEEGLWDELIASKQYIQWKRNLNKSYFWDSLLHKTFFFIENGILEHTTIPSIQEQANLFLRLAKENRAHRLILSESFLSFFQTIPTDYRGTRIIFFDDEPGICYLLLLLPHVHSQSENNYRSLRRDLLSDYCYIAKSDYPTIKQVIGVAHDTSEIDYSSEDFILLDASAWTEQDQKQAEDLKEEFCKNGLLNERKMFSINAPSGRKMKGRDRNKPCPCGSGKKYKNCCGRGQ